MKTALLLAILPALALAQLEEKTTEHRSYSGVQEFIVDNVTGDIEVTAGPGNSVQVQIDKTLRAESADRMALAKKEISLAETRQGGLVRLLVDGPFRCHCGDDSIQFHGRPLYRFAYNFKVQVPKNIALELHTVNGSRIFVRGTSGDFKISNVNGEIEMRDVAGSGSVSTVNGPVTVTFARNPTAATSFKSVNGTLDVSFVAGLNADARMKTMHGGMFTDFPVTALPVAAMQPERRDGKFVWKSDRMTAVRIGRGGPELRFETLNGDVLIKSREKK